MLSWFWTKKGREEESALGIYSAAAFSIRTELTAEKGALWQVIKHNLCPKTCFFFMWKSEFIGVQNGTFVVATYKKTDLCVFFLQKVPFYRLLCWKPGNGEFVLNPCFGVNLERLHEFGLLSRLKWSMKPCPKQSFAQSINMLTTSQMKSGWESTLWQKREAVLNRGANTIRWQQNSSK